MIGKKTALSGAIAAALSLSVGTAQALTITWSGNAVKAPTFNSAFADPDATGQFSNTAEFRMFNTATGAIGGGGPGSGASGFEKDTFFGGETWTFTGGTMTGVTGTPANPGAPNAPAGTNPTLQQDALFFFAPFNFLAPTLGSTAAGLFGPGTVTFDSTDNWSMFFPVLDAQWNMSDFTLGSNGGAGITFNCNGALSGNVECQAEELIDASEDPSGSFVGWAAQWDIVGTLDAPHVPGGSPVPVPAAVWLFGSGLVGLVGVARRKKTGA